MVLMKTIAPEWSEEIDRRRDGMVALRRDFHRHPELSFEERRTAEIIAERLHAAKLEVRTGIARTGVVGVLRGDRPGPHHRLARRHRRAARSPRSSTRPSPRRRRA